MAYIKGNKVLFSARIGGSSSDSGSGSDEVVSNGKHLIQVIDYDGNVIKKAKLDTGEVFELPTEPTHDRLTFQEWASPVAITDNKITVGSTDITIAPVYVTTSGLTEFDITLTKATGLSVTLNMDGTKDWGDGTSDTSTSHTYTNYGDYTITCNGSTMTTSSSSYLLGGGSTDSYKGAWLTGARFGDNITVIRDYAFSGCTNLSSVTIPNNVTSINSYAFRDCDSLTTFIIPKNITYVGEYAFNKCSGLRDVTIGQGVTTIYQYTFAYCESLKRVTMSNSVTQINTNAFNFNYAITIYDFSNNTSVPTLAATSGIGKNNLTKIIVPDSLYDEWIAATNWSSLAKYIYKASEVA